MYVYNSASMTVNSNDKASKLRNNHNKASFPKDPEKHPIYKQTGDRYLGTTKHQKTISS